LTSAALSDMLWLQGLLRSRRRKDDCGYCAARARAQTFFRSRFTRGAIRFAQPAGLVKNQRPRRSRTLVGIAVGHISRSKDVIAHAGYEVLIAHLKSVFPLENEPGLVFAPPLSDDLLPRDQYIPPSALADLKNAPLAGRLLRGSAGARGSQADRRTQALVIRREITDKPAVALLYDPTYNERRKLRTSCCSFTFNLWNCSMTRVASLPGLRWASIASRRLLVRPS